ncbi:hypothetical protein AB0K52_02020 [Glycomyces sp. NPDC049804]|uniref:hypothetical protein n=1 Tax=Glycomyces sp. NPDC049804 TaxID=3154363 RepID=UPI0034269F54
MAPTHTVYIDEPDTARADEVNDLAAYLDTCEFHGKTPPPTVSATMSLTGRLTQLSLPEAVFEYEEEISEKTTALLEEMRQTAQRATVRLLQERLGSR